MVIGKEEKEMAAANVVIMMGAMNKAHAETPMNKEDAFVILLLLFVVSVIAVGICWYMERKDNG